MYYKEEQKHANCSNVQIQRFFFLARKGNPPSALSHTKLIHFSNLNIFLFLILNPKNLLNPSLTACWKFYSDYDIWAAVTAGWLAFSGLSCWPRNLPSELSAIPKETLHSLLVRHFPNRWQVRFKYLSTYGWI